MAFGKHEVLRKLDAAGLPVPPFIEVSVVDDPRLSDLSGIFGTGRRYAVRSSAVDEDGVGRSFAGQYETLLGVVESDVPDAVRQVFDSYGRDTVYDDVVMGTSLGSVVIVQVMVDVEFSGIAFTSNPEGFVGERVVVIGCGLGSGVVSDSVDVETWHVTDGATWSVGHMHDGSHVTSSCVRSVLDLLSQAQSVLGCETDMEFAVDANGDVHVLQARPITAVAGVPCDEALAEAVLLDNSNIVESYPGVSLPLTQSFVRAIYERIFQAAVLRLTGSQDVVDGMSDVFSNMVAFCDWHAYYCMASWYAVLSMLPFAERVKKVWRKSLGVSESVSPDGMSFSFGMKARVFVRALCVWHRIPRLTTEVCEDVEVCLDDVERRLAGLGTVDELLSLYDGLFERVLSVWDITLFNDMYAFLNTAASGDDFTASGTLASMAPLESVSGLIAVARTEGLDSEAYVEARDAFVAEFGNRVVGELKLETCTWKTDVSLLDAYVASNLNTDVAVSDISEVRSVRHGVRHFLFARSARHGVELRERSRLLRSRMFGIVREIFLRVGSCLVADGVLADARDVFYLDIGSIRRFASGDDVDLAGAVRVAKACESRMASLPVVDRVLAVGDGPWMHTMPVDASSVGSQGRLSAGDVLFGTGTSGGVVRGEVIRLGVDDAIRRAHDVAGRIVVAVSTDPGWALVLRSAAGIVAERGSLLSHTSIIARELHVPAVVGVANAFELLHDGDVVEVNGDTGMVTLIGQ